MAARTGGQHTIAAVAAPPDRPLSALPSRKARALAFTAILAGGLCGALIGSSFVRIQCEKDCTTESGVAGVVGALIAAAGVAVVAVLVLRAMGEWRRIAALEAPGDDENENDNDNAAVEAAGDDGNENDVARDGSRQAVRRRRRKPSA